MIFLLPTHGSVGYLTLSRADVIEATPHSDCLAVASRPGREKVMLGYYAAVAVATGVLLVWAAAKPHNPAGAASELEYIPSPPYGTVKAQAAGAAFPPAEIAKFRVIAQDTLAKVQAGDQVGAVNRVKDLETAWDNEQATLQPMNSTAWLILDGQIDATLKAVRSSKPDRAAQTQTLTTLLGIWR